MGAKSLREEIQKEIIDESIGVCMFYGYGDCDCLCEYNQDGLCMKYDGQELILTNSGHFSHFYIKNTLVQK
jgi:hypothetical protein